MPSYLNSRHMSAEWTDVVPTSLLLDNLDEWNREQTLERDIDMLYLYPPVARSSPSRPHTSTGTSTGHQHDPVIVPSYQDESEYYKYFLRNGDQDLAQTEPFDIGIALGSPDDLQMPEIQTSARPWMSRAFTEMPGASMSNKKFASTLETRPMMKRWQTVSSMFNKRKSLRRREVKEVTRPKTSGNHEDEATRFGQYMHRAKKSTPPAPQQSEFVVFKPAVEQPQPRSTLLNVDIPSSGFERYSVMFSNVLDDPAQPPARQHQSNTSLLERRPNAIDNLTIKSPTESSYGPGQSFKRVSLTANKQPLNPATLLTSIPASPPTPQDDRFSNPHNLLRRSNTAIGLSSTYGQPALSRATAPQPQRSQSERIYDRFSNISAYAFPTPPQVVIQPQLTASPQLSVYHPDSLRTPSRLSAVTTNESRLSATSAIENGSDSRYLTTRSPSPRFAYGYDAPHSPLVAMARQVCVMTVRRGNDRQPQGAGQPSLKLEFKENSIGTPRGYPPSYDAPAAERQDHCETPPDQSKGTSDDDTYYTDDDYQDAYEYGNEYEYEHQDVYEDEYEDEYYNEDEDEDEDGDGLKATPIHSTTGRVSALGMASRTPILVGSNGTGLGIRPRSFSVEPES